MNLINRYRYIKQIDTSKFIRKPILQQQHFKDTLNPPPNTFIYIVIVGGVIYWYINKKPSSGAYAYIPRLT